MNLNKSTNPISSSSQVIKRTKKIPSIVGPSAERKMIEFRRIAPGNHLHFLCRHKPRKKLEKSTKSLGGPSLLKCPRIQHGEKEEKSFLSAHTWNMLSQRNFFGFHSSCFFLSFFLSFGLLYSRFSCRRKFLSKRAKRKEKRLQHYAITSQEKKIVGKAKQKAGEEKSRETSVRFEEERSGTIRWINFCRDEMRRERDERSSWQFKGCLFTSSNWQLQNRLFSSASRKFILEAVVDVSLFCENTTDFRQNWTHVWGSLKGCLLPAFSFQRALSSPKMFFQRKNARNFCFETFFSRVTCLCGTERTKLGVEFQGKRLKAALKFNFATTCCPNGWSEFRRSRST